MPLQELGVFEIPEKFKAEISDLSKALVQWLQAEFHKVQAAVIEAIRKPLEETPIYAAVIAINPDCTDDERMAAIDRLAASAAFSRRALFHPSRWAALSNAFASYCAERELTAKEAWLEVVRTALIIGLDEAAREAEDAPLIEFWRTARREVRREIEKGLLDGKTLDEKGEDEALEEETFLLDWFDFEPDGEIEEYKVELVHRIAGLLTLRELQALIDNPTDKASLMARKRARDKVRKAGIDLPLNQPNR